MKYNIPVGFSFDNNILIITEKFTLIFGKTCRANSKKKKRAYQRALRALQGDNKVFIQFECECVAHWFM